MNELQIFNFKENKVRTLTINNEPFFVGKDVARVLGYKRTADAISGHVDEEDKGVGEIQTPGGIQKAMIINESGLYSLIFASKLDTAKTFKRWVTSEVLPSIRKQGMYMTSTLAQEITDNPEIIHYLAEQVAKINTSNNKYHEETSNKLAGIDKKIEGEYASPQDIDAIKYATKIKAEKILDSIGMQITIDSLLSNSTNVYEQAQINKQQKRQYRHDLGRFKSRILVETKKKLGMKGNDPNNHIKRKNVDAAIQIIKVMKRNEINV